MILKSPPYLVLSDWNMPEMNGIELLNELRRRQNGVRFGFVTTEATPEMRELALAQGALFLLAKPFTPKDLSNLLDPILEP
jgi:two-component system chemotaxis response regulator CheY